MTRLRRYIPVAAYFGGFVTVVELHQQGIITSEVPSFVFAGVGFAWLFAFIWRNRAGGPNNPVVADRPNLDPYDPMSIAYQSSGTASIQHDARSGFD